MSAKGEQNISLVNGVENSRASDRSTPTEESFGKFIYNREKGTVLNRTAKSWCQILVFYVIFYAFLLAFFVSCLSIFLSTLDPKVPRFYGKGTIIGVNPGVGYQPWLKEKPDSTLIKFNLRESATWEPYVAQLNKYLEKYENTTNTRECGEGDSNDALETSNDTLPCRFDLEQFHKGLCGPANSYGYKSGAPCVVVSLNRLIGWRPVNYEAGSVPEQIKDRYKKDSITIDCQGANDIDKEHLGKLKYIPSSGIDGRYYPYVFTPGYHQPIAMIKFESLPRNKLVVVECRAFALNIEHDISTRLGMVYFELFVEDKPVEKKEL